MKWNSHATMIDSIYASLSGSSDEKVSGSSSRTALKSGVS